MQNEPNPEFPALSGYSQTSADDGWPEQLAVRISRYYYELGLTQQQIAAKLGVTRARVNKLLSEARQRGIVTIRINSPLLENLELADQLSEHFKLDNAEVCLVQATNEQGLARQIGAIAGEYILRFIQDDMAISVGWGMTLRELVMQLEPRITRNVSVVSLLGSLTRMSSIARYQATTGLAERLSAECHYLAAPIVCDSPGMREMLVSQTMIKETHRMALSSDMAIVSIGGLDSATIRKVDMVNDEEFQSIQNAGAIGNFLGYYIDSEGAIVDHPLNKRIIGVAGDEFKSIPKRIMISGGASKVPALLAVLRQGLVSDLITDAQTARALLDSPS